jgi:hypothetical protein
VFTAEFELDHADPELVSVLAEESDVVEVVPVTLELPVEVLEVGEFVPVLLEAPVEAVEVVDSPLCTLATWCACTWCSAPRCDGTTRYSRPSTIGIN